MSARDLDRRREVTADFVSRWHHFVREFGTARRRGPEAASQLVQRALREGLPPVVDEVVLAPAGDLQDDAARCLVAASDFLDVDGYALHHRLRRGTDPVRHFVEQGWRALQNPSPRFDLWSYWVEHLDPTTDQVNPLLHYLLVGRHQALPPVPVGAEPRTPTRYPAGTTPRRACLFAAYDRDGVVDDYVVDYLAELSRFADVYYLADGVLEPGELDKLSSITAGAWSIPHAAYDFGSFSMLARDLVGWTALERYDEVILANDSCYLLRPLDEVFARMDARACDWWGLQATSMEHDESYAGGDDPIPLAEAKARFNGPRRWSDVHYLHLSSYFLVFRAPVLGDEGFRWRLDTVTGQVDKSLVVHKYEVGISRYLMDAGFDFDTFVGELYAFHPLYSRHYFELVERGFPLVKRNFLGENPRGVPGLENWPERLRSLLPEAPVTTMQANLTRVTPVHRLHEAYAVRRDAEGRRYLPERAVRGFALRRLDRETPLFDHWWGFPTSASGRLDPGLRAVFEEVRDDPSLRKWVFSRARQLEVELAGPGVTVLPLDTAAGQEALVRCGLVLVDQEPNVMLPLPLSGARRRFVHLGIGLPEVPHPVVRSPLGEWRKVTALAVTSHAEALVRAAAEGELDLARTWVTGLPRHDPLVLAPEMLPADVRAAEERLRHRVGDRRLVVFWPHGDAAAAYTGDQVTALREWALRHDAVIGVREPTVDRLDGLTMAFGGLGALGLSERAVASSTVVHRVASAVVTDHSPVAFDALVTGTPLLLHPRGASPTVANAAAFSADGWPPARHCPTFEVLLAELTALAVAGFPADSVAGDRDGVAALDGGAAGRVVARLRALRRD